MQSAWSIEGPSYYSKHGVLKQVFSEGTIYPEWAKTGLRLKGVGEKSSRYPKGLWPSKGEPYPTKSHSLLFHFSPEAEFKLNLMFLVQEAI